MTTDEIDDSGAALVCTHVADQSQPIRLAFRIEPAEPVDSGWQFFCGNTAEEDPSTARVWSLRDVLNDQPSLRRFLSAPPGTELVLRAGKWSIRK